MCGGVKGNISSCPANPFNFQRLANKIYVKGCLRAIIRGRVSSFPFFNSSPNLHFQPENVINLFHLSAWAFHPNFQSSPTQTKQAKRYPPFWSRVVKYFLAPRRPVLSNHFSKRNAFNLSANFDIIKPSTPQNRLPMG